MQAKTDELTGLPNARSLSPHFQNELLRCAARGEQMTVVVCDLDGFKEVNDRFGHLAGNELLKQISLILRENCRASDYVARLGGDEFIVLLGTIQEHDRNAWFERIDRLVTEAGYKICGDRHLGVSTGIARYPDHGSDPETLIAHADNHMYSVKRARKAIRTRYPEFRSTGVEAVADDNLIEQLANLSSHPI